MRLQGKVLQFTLTQLLTNLSAMARAVEIQPEEVGLATLALTGLPGLFMTTGASMPALALHLLTQILLKLQG